MSTSVDEAHGPLDEMSSELVLLLKALVKRRGGSVRVSNRELKAVKDLSLTTAGCAGFVIIEIGTSDEMEQTYQSMVARAKGACAPPN